MRKYVYVMLAVILFIALTAMAACGIGPINKEPPEAGQGKEELKQTSQAKSREVKKAPKKPKADLSGVYPILNGFGLIMGGIVDGLWVNNDEISRQIEGGEKYKLYCNEQYIGQAVGSKPLEQQYISGDKGYRVELEGQNGLNADGYGIIGSWNPLPAMLKTQTTGLEKYQKPVGDVLRKTGFDGRDEGIKEVKKVDLDNDGMEEAIIIATNITEEDMNRNTDGDPGLFQGKYSLVILQRHIDGEELNTVVSQRFNAGQIFQVPFIADVDGDGQMEFLVRTVNVQMVPVEGWASTHDDLYKIKDRDIERKLSIFYHPI
ncbi:hypothetical protein DCCM_2846 [Desulfocucumis palustris]|uniref:Uncharacterized protein n=1 Tax=Desulfocucumis palustris TaxID=1898651 RepID=A0A2L2XHM5_9FIRM|nr:hypothetical protein [Desulfocucumis palustris]GBF33736.1 hypothetical protein DCCM_2846 [Desulfocucumis palustris]